MKLNILNEFPEELLYTDIKNIHDVLGGPTLFHLKGKDDNALFLSTLLHANETSSFYVLQKLIRKYQNQQLPRDLIIFIGNTYAALEGMRHLPGQADYNRIWEKGESAENALALDVTDYARSQKIFASIDIHNNTGRNPHYSCINVLKKNFLDLASHFGEHIVFFIEPNNVQSMAFSQFCTSVTIETGVPGDQEGIAAALTFVDKVFNMDKEISRSQEKDIEVFHTIGRIKIPQKVRVDFDDELASESDLSLVSNIDSRNFQFIPKGTHLGFIKNLSLIQVIGNDASDITSDFLEVFEGELRTKRLFVPSMFTKDTYVMKEDCLGYIMELITLNNSD